MLTNLKTNFMKSFFNLYILPLFSVLVLFTSCSTNDDDPVPDETIINSVTGADSCSNVVIVDGYAYAACGTELEVINLSSRARNVLPIPSDDIAFDASNGNLFVQSRTNIQALSIVDPFSPNVIASGSTNFGSFSGIDAANGVVVVSGGNRSNNTQVYTFSANTFNLVANGIPAVDNVMGNPDVHVVETANGLRAFYSQDLSAVTNWGIQVIDFSTNGTVTNTEDVIVLNSQRFTGTFASIGPANFPVESEFLNGRLYVAHFAVNGLEIVDFNTGNTTSIIDLGYQPVNVATDGILLFTVGTTSKIISILDPETNTLQTRTVDAIEQARGIAVSQDYIAIADRVEGLIVVDRNVTP